MTPTEAQIKKAKDLVEKYTEGNFWDVNESPEIVVNALAQLLAEESQIDLPNGEEIMISVIHPGEYRIIIEKGVVKDIQRIR